MVRLLDRYGHDWLESKLDGYLLAENMLDMRVVDTMLD